MKSKINQEYRGFTINIRVEEPLVIHTMTDYVVSYVTMTDKKIDIDKFKSIIDIFLGVEKQKSLTVQVPNEYQNINQNAFNEWMSYKKYKNKGAITKTLNMLNKYDFQTQQEMVDKSIMNEYKGLFEPKQSKQPMQSFKQQDEAYTRNVVNSYLDSGYSLRDSHSDNDIDVQEISHDR